MAFIDSGYTLARYKEIYSNPDHAVSQPLWSEQSNPPPLPSVKDQAGASKKGPQPRTRFRGRNDNCQRGRGSGDGRGGGGITPAPPVHGMSSVRSYVGDLRAGGPTGDERPSAGVWGPLAVERYDSQDASRGGSAAGAGAGSSATQSLSQESIDLSEFHVFQGGLSKFKISRKSLPWRHATGKSTVIEGTRQAVFRVCGRVIAYVSSVCVE